MDKKEEKKTIIRTSKEVRKKEKKKKKKKIRILNQPPHPRPIPSGFLNPIPQLQKKKKKKLIPQPSPPPPRPCHGEEKKDLSIFSNKYVGVTDRGKEMASM